MCYNSKREARNRLALVCVLPGQTGLYRFFNFSFFSILPTDAHRIKRNGEFCPRYSIYMYVYIYVSIC